MTHHGSTDKIIRNHYQQQHLSVEKLQQMIDIAQLKNQQTIPVEHSSKKRWIVQRNISIAASVILAVVISLQWMTRPLTQQQLAVSVAQEIAINHQKQFDSDFTESSYESLSNMMTKLDFKLISPVQLNEEKLQILGGRYCSLNGQIAAQIRLKNNRGEIFTLYQTHSREAFKTLTDYAQQVNGIKIKMWNEGDIFLGIAG